MTEQSVSDHHAHDAQQKLNERLALEAELAAGAIEVEGLLVAAETGDVAAQARLEHLERREIEVRRLIKQKLATERHYHVLADGARVKEALDRDRRQRQAFLKRAVALPARAKDLERATSSLLVALTAYTKLADDLHLAFSDSKWPHQAPAYLYPEKVKSFIAQHIYVAMREADVKKFPTPAYSQADWPGLEAKVKEGVAWLKSTLGGDTLPAPELVRPDYVEPEPAPAEPAEPIEIISGRDWQRQEDNAAAMRRPVQSVEFDVFTGLPLTRDDDPI